MKIIFLDFDGVIKPLHADFSIKAAQRVNQLLVKDPALRIVVSSNWRIYGLQMVRGILRDIGIDPVKVIDITGGNPDHANKSRDHHIKKWLREHADVENFAILDDEFEMPDFKHKYVQTDPMAGFTDKDAEKVSAILSKKEKYG